MVLPSAERRAEVLIAQSTRKTREVLEQLRSKGRDHIDKPFVIASLDGGYDREI